MFRFLGRGARDYSSFLGQMFGYLIGGFREFRELENKSPLYGKIMQKWKKVIPWLLGIYAVLYLISFFIKHPVGSEGFASDLGFTVIVGIVGAPIAYFVLRHILFFGVLYSLAYAMGGFH